MPTTHLNRWPRALRLIALGWLVASLAACSSLGMQDPLRVELVGLEPLPGQGMELRMDVVLRVQNPNDASIDYSGIALELDINDQPLASGVSAQSGQLTGFGEALVRIPVSISAFSMLRQAWAANGFKTGQKLPYALRGKFGGGLFGSTRFSRDGELQWPANTPPL